MPCTCPLAVSLALTLPLAGAPVEAPMCPRTDNPLASSLVGDARIQPAATDPQFEAAIRAIRGAATPKPASRRRHR